MLSGVVIGGVYLHHYYVTEVSVPALMLQRGWPVCSVTMVTPAVFAVTGCNHDPNDSHHPKPKVEVEVRPSVHPLTSCVHPGGAGVLLWHEISGGGLHGPGRR